MASKDFSNRLKELRKRAGYTQKEVYEHFNIPQSTFSSWEVGKSEPSGEMLMQLCDFYKCDIMKEFSKGDDDIVTNTDLELLKMYHALDEHGRKMVDFTLKEEYERSVPLKTKRNNIYDFKPNASSTKIAEDTCPYDVNAAHADEDATEEDKKHDDDIMDDDNF